MLEGLGVGVLEWVYLELIGGWGRGWSLVRRGFIGRFYVWSFG